MIKRYRLFGVFLGIIAAGSLMMVIVSAGYYPIATVNGKFVSSRQFRKDYRANSLYYWNTIKTYRPDLASQATIPSLELQLSVLNQIIENMLVSQGAQKELGTDTPKLVAEKLGELEGDMEFRKAAETLYGLSFPDFKKEILVPQAERDLLSGRLFLRGEKIDEWLANAKRSSKVRIFSSRFYWDTDKVKSR